VLARGSSIQTRNTLHQVGSGMWSTYQVKYSLLIGLRGQWVSSTDFNFNIGRPRQGIHLADIEYARNFEYSGWRKLSANKYDSGDGRCDIVSQRKSDGALEVWRNDYDISTNKWKFTYSGFINSGPTCSGSSSFLNYYPFHCHLGVESCLWRCSLQGYTRYSGTSFAPGCHPWVSQWSKLTLELLEIEGWGVGATDRGVQLADLKWVTASETEVTVIKRYVVNAMRSSDGRADYLCFE